MEEPPDIFAEIAAGQGLSITQAARRLPSSRNGRPVSFASVFRWILKGVRIWDGRTVRLEAARLGRKWVTTPAAIQRFVMAQTPELESQDKLKRIRTPGQRERAALRAAKELEKLGI